MAKKTAIYIRISTQLQHSDRQKEELLKLAENEGYEVVDTYIDILSGFKDEEFRPELKRLLEDSEHKKFDIILFSEFSRLSRTIADLNKFIVEFRKNNIELFFQKQNQWVKKKGDVGTNILIQVLGVLSEYEIELFKERSISGKISAVKNRGINIGGLTAYGYKSEKDTKRLIVDIERSDSWGWFVDIDTAIPFNNCAGITLKNKYPKIFSKDLTVLSTINELPSIRSMKSMKNLQDMTFKYEMEELYGANPYNNDTNIEYNNAKNNKTDIFNTMCVIGVVGLYYLIIAL